MGAGASFITNVPAATAIARSWLAFLRGDAEEMAGFAAHARARLRDGEWMLASICRLNVALADWLRGRLGAAEQHFTAAIAEWQAAGHQVGLNFGDCFAYALAKSTGEALLFKGDDFAHTDVRPALPAAPDNRSG